MSNSKNNMTWDEQSEYFEKNNFWLVKSRKLALKILMHLKKEKISQKNLAERLEVSPQQINKIVRGGSNNMTFQTICKLERELGIELIKIPEAISWSEIVSSSGKTFAAQIKYTVPDNTGFFIFNLPKKQINSESQNSIEKSGKIISLYNSKQTIASNEFASNALPIAK